MWCGIPAGDGVPRSRLTTGNSSFTLHVVCGGNIRGAEPKSLGRRKNLHDAAILDAETPDVDGGRFYAKHRKRRADLAPMLSAVVQRFRQPNAQGSVPLVAVAFVDLSQNCVRIEVFTEEPRPGPRRCAPSRLAAL